jgi:pantothenate kinase type III
MDNCLLLVLIGRTHTRLARVVASKGTTPTSPAQPGPDLQPAPPIVHEALLAGGAAPASLSSADRLAEPLAQQLSTWIRAARQPGANAQPADRTLIASADDALAQRIATRLSTLGITDVSTLVAPGRAAPAGRSHAVPLVIDSGATSAIGTDRLLAALGASARLGQAVAIVDAGALLTIDLCDRHGVLVGGTAAPGLSATLEAAHAAASQSVGPPLPLVARPPTAAALPTGAMSLDAGDATLLGAVHAARGLVRYQVELMAEVGGVYPRVVATGPDAALLLDRDELVEHIVPDLGLIGMLEAWTRLNADPDDGTGALPLDELDDDNNDEGDDDVLADDATSTRGGGPR